MQKQSFTFLGRNFDLWLHAEPDHISQVIRQSRNFYELDVLMKCREIYLPGTVIIDIGANIGNHAVFFGAVLGAPVYAIEPYAPNLERLELNIAANGLERTVFATGVAIGAADAHGTLQPGPATNFGMTRVNVGAGETVVRSLDSLQISGRIGLLKIDVEGAEPAVLVGAAGLILRWLPDIVIEAGDAAAFDAIASTLLDFGYTPRGRFAATPTYLFSAVNQVQRLDALLAGRVARAA